MNLPCVSNLLSLALSVILYSDVIIACYLFHSPEVVNRSIFLVRVFIFVFDLLSLFFV